MIYKNQSMLLFTITVWLQEWSCRNAHGSLYFFFKDFFCLFLEISCRSFLKPFLNVRFDVEKGLFFERLPADCIPFSIPRYLFIRGSYLGNRYIVYWLYVFVLRQYFIVYWSCHFALIQCRKFNWFMALRTDIFSLHINNAALPINLIHCLSAMPHCILINSIALKQCHRFFLFIPLSIDFISSLTLNELL